MKKFTTSLIVSLIMSQQILIAQNVGIGTTSPQATLDVKGNLRTGGNSNFIDFDTLSGKITWTNSNLWVTSPQYLMKHSASAEGLYSNGAQLEYRNSTGNPIFFTNWTNGNGYFSGKLGINTINPGARLHIYNGASGITPFFSSSVVVENNSHSYINLLSPDPFETGILFGSGTNATSGIISYNTTNTPKGFTFSDNGNLTRMVIDNAGYVGIGTTAPSSKLEITHNGSSTYGTALLINQDVIGNSDGPKIQFKKTMTASKSWTAGILNGVDVGTFSVNEDGGTGGFGTPRFTIKTGGNIGIGTTNPQYTLDINGPIAFNGNAGQSGQLLQSVGPGSPAVWANPTKNFYFEQTTGNIVTLQNVFSFISGINGQSFQVDSYSDLVITFNGLVGISSSGTADQNPSILIIIYKGAAEVGRFNAYTFLKNFATYGVGTNLTSSFHIRNATAGLYSVECKAQKFDVTGASELTKAQLRIQVIPQ